MAKTPVKPLIYKPPPRWHVWAALGGALAIHLTAVAVTQKHEAAAELPPPPPPAVVEATIQPPEATPPPEDIPLPEPPPPPEIKPEFVEERTPPPRPPPSAPKYTPIKASEMSMSRAKALAVVAPKPPYPYEARAHHIMGSGVITVDVDAASGSVTDAHVTQSMGNNLLDDAAVSTFRRWRFRPGTVSRVRIPITFTMTGASY